MNRIYLLVYTLVLFLGINLTNTLGLDYKVVSSIILCLSIFPLFNNKKYISKSKSYFFLFIFVVIYSILKISLDNSEGSKILSFNLLYAVILFGGVTFIFNTNKISRKEYFILKNMFLILIFFYLFETSFAFLERILGVNILSWNSNEIGAGFEYSETGFRSTALHGHPLQNALIVSTMMSFILVSSMKISYRILLWLLGFLSILCFNTRASIVGNVLIFIVFLCYYLYTNKKKRFSLITLIIICCFVLSYLIFSLGLGNRLFEMGLYDEESAQVRIDMFSIFSYFKIEDFLFGKSLSDYNLIMYHSGLKVTENFWIDYLLTYGLILLLLYVFLYYKLLTFLYKGYSKIQKLITFSTFILLASTNNSLSATPVPIIIYLWCIVIFNPMYSYRIFPKKVILKLRSNIQRV